MKLFKHGLLAAGLSVGVLAASASAASAVSISPAGPVTGTSFGTSFIVNGGASVGCAINVAAGTIATPPNNPEIPLSSVVFGGCRTSFNTGADVTPVGEWTIVAEDSAGNGYIDIGGAEVDTGICVIDVSAQQVDGWVDDVADVLYVFDSSVAFTSGGFGCFFSGVPSSGTATFDATTNPYELDENITVS